MYILWILWFCFTNSLRPSDSYMRLTIVGSDNGLSPGRRQVIFWTNAWILLIEPLGTNFSAILIEILTFSFKKMHILRNGGHFVLASMCWNILTLLMISEFMWLINQIAKHTKVWTMCVRGAVHGHKSRYAHFMIILLLQYSVCGRSQFISDAITTGLLWPSFLCYLFIQCQVIAQISAWH